MEFLTVDNVVKVLGGLFTLISGIAAWKSRRSSEKAKLSEQQTANSATDVKKLTEALQEKVETIDEQTIKIRQLETTVRVQQQELESVKNSNSIMQGDFTRAIRLLDEVQQERDVLMDRIKQLEDRLQVLEANLKEAEAKNNTLTAELSAKVEENRQLKARAEELLVQINTLESQLRTSLGL